MGYCQVVYFLFTIWEYLKTEGVWTDSVKLNWCIRGKLYTENSWDASLQYLTSWREPLHLTSITFQLTHSPEFSGRVFYLQLVRGFFDGIRCSLLPGWSSFHSEPAGQKQKDNEMLLIVSFSWFLCFSSFLSFSLTAESYSLSTAFVFCSTLVFQEPFVFWDTQIHPCGLGLCYGE